MTVHRVRQAGTERPTSRTAIWGTGNGMLNNLIRRLWQGRQLTAFIGCGPAWKPA